MVLVFLERVTEAQRMANAELRESNFGKKRKPDTDKPEFKKLLLTNQKKKKKN